MRLLNEENKTIEECHLKPKQLAGMLKLIDKGAISGKIAKTVFEEMYKTGKDAEIIVKEKGLVQISDSSVIEKAVDEVISKNPKEVERFKAGDEKAPRVLCGSDYEAHKRQGKPADCE